MNDTVRIGKGQTLSVLYDALDLGMLKERKLKRYMKEHNDIVSAIQPWSYVFSGGYTAEELLNVFATWPTQTYEHITLLEGWSIYDIDEQLFAQDYIEQWAYIAYVTDQERLREFADAFDFLSLARQERGLTTLEWYVYPDTYFIDRNKDVLDQLVTLQLQSFEKKIWEPYGDDIRTINTRLASIGLDFSLTSYGVLTLASVIEKEERVDANRPAIAWVFFNRLNDGMRIDADITLCYGLGRWYEWCTPQVIVNNLYDKSNPYNTRAVAWLPPTPIVTPTVASVTAILEAEKSPYYFYLHDPQWRIHLAASLSEHNSNKRTYLD